jgi:hypothetical protein
MAFADRIRFQKPELRLGREKKAAPPAAKPLTAQESAAVTAAIRATNTRAELATKSTAGKAMPKAGAQGRALAPHEIAGLVRKAMVAIASEYGEGVPMRRLVAPRV